MYDFANILLTGRCNRRCPHCIGHALAGRALPDSLGLFPLPGLAEFLVALRRHTICEVSLTGTNTDPLLYLHLDRLIDCLREEVPGIRLSLHTNGALALRRIRVFNRFDRATVSLPSFRPGTCRRMTGSPRVPDLAEILRLSDIPVKVSTLVTPGNRAEIPEILRRCRELGVRRLVFRRLYGDPSPADFFPGRKPVRTFGGNPVYDLGGMEVTVWDFRHSTLRCLNLFSDGSVGDAYELAR
jgi:MoaA/NifB/PqqE/SkfB family radical SAM enzyme